MASTGSLTCSGVVGYFVCADLPLEEAAPALFVLAGLALFGVWQWSEASVLRRRLRSLEAELLKDTEYQRPA